MVLNRKGRAISWHKGIDGAYHQRHGAAEAEPVSIISLPNSIPQPSIQKSSLVREELIVFYPIFQRTTSEKPLQRKGLKATVKSTNVTAFIYFVVPKAP